MTLQEMTRAALDRDPASAVLQFEGRWHSLGEIRAVADSLKALIAASGAGPSAAVTLVPRNAPEAIAALLGLIADGRTIRMVYPFQSPEGIARDIERLRSAVVVAARRDLGDAVRAAIERTGAAAIALDGLRAEAIAGLERTRSPEIGSESVSGNGSKSLYGQRSNGAEIGSESISGGNSNGAIPAPERPEIQILTSGTTGAPKQFPIAHDLIARFHVAPRLSPGREAEVAKEAPTLLFFPLGNISGVYSTLPALLRGQRAILLERFSLDAWRAYIREYRPAMGGGPPAAVQMILDANVPKEELSSLRGFATGAAPLDPTVQRAFEDRYGIPILLSYGATEFAGPVCGMTPELHAQWGRTKHGTVGRAYPGAQLRVIDAGTGAELPAGEEGLLEVISPRMESRWIRTSDVGVIDEDGFVFLRGRADGAIMRGGFKLLPETIERALLTHPAIAECAVVGVTDRRLGQVPAAAMRLKPDAVQPSIDELEAHLRQNVLATHIPTQWRFVVELPRNPSLKIDRRGVVQLFGGA